MSDIIVARDPDIVAAEIITIQQQARKMMLIYAVEIGKRLCEAKELLDHGQWGRWLEESVSYSQSTANNLMSLYREYGDKDQSSLFDDGTNSQLLQKLSYTQALALMAVPAEERAAFVTENKVEDMSTRELQRVIRERDEARAESQKYFDQLTDKEDELWDANRRADEASQNAQVLAKTVQESTVKVNQLQSVVDSVKADKTKAEEAVADLRAKLDKAKAAAKKAREDLKAAEENPVVSEDVMAKLRQEAEEAAAKRSAEEADKKLIELQKKLDEANAAADAATQKQADAEAQLVAAQKAVKMAAPEIAVFKSMFETLQDGINKINGYRLRTAQSNLDAADSMRKALTALYTKALEDNKNA